MTKHKYIVSGVTSSGALFESTCIDTDIIKAIEQYREIGLFVHNIARGEQVMADSQVKVNDIAKKHNSIRQVVVSENNGRVQGYLTSSNWEEMCKKRKEDVLNMNNPRDLFGRAVIVNGVEGEISNILGVQFFEVTFFNVNDGKTIIEIKDVDKYLVK